ncbi:MAG: hypothetical protein WA947_21120 [Phormidesmis sp.]
MASFESSYPHIASWVADGCLEIGNIHPYDTSTFICAMDEGGTIWESPDCFETLDEALAAADAGIREWYKSNVPELVEEKEASPPFTSKQGQYLAYIYNYIQISGRSPTQDDMKSFFGATLPTVQKMILKLESLGLIGQVADQARSLSVFVPVERLPILIRP